MIEIDTKCPHCNAPTVFGECSECFWIEEQLIENVKLDERNFEFPFLME